MGYQPRTVWKQVKSVFLSAAKIPPVLDAYYAQITRELEIGSIDHAHPIGKTVQLLRQGILRTLARLALAAMQSMQAAEGKREQALKHAKTLDDLLEQHQATEEALNDVSKPPMNPKKLKEKTDLTAEAASEVDAIQKLADEMRDMGWIFKGYHARLSAANSGAHAQEAKEKEGKVIRRSRCNCRHSTTGLRKDEGKLKPASRSGRSLWSKCIYARRCQQQQRSKPGIC